MNEKLDTMLEQEQPTLSQEERDAMFVKIAAKTAGPIPSLYFAFIHTRTMATLLIALMIALGTSGTVLASNDAKPGDLLFPIERASEQIRLAITAEAKKEDLRQKYAEERLAELREIIREEVEDDSEDTSTTTDDSFVTVDSDGEVRISTAVQVLLDYLEGVKTTDNKTALLTELAVELDAIKVAGRTEGNTNVWTDDARLHIKDDRIEVKQDGYKIRIDNDGEIEIKSRHNSDDNRNDDDDDSRDDSDDDRRSDAASFEAEADVYADGTTVEVEINGKKSIFTTSADTKEEIAAEIARRYDVTVATVMAVLDIEIEDGSIDGDDESREDDDSRNDESNTGIDKFEVRVEGLKAEVRIEYGNDKKLEYETVYTTKAALLAEVALKTGLATADLSSALDLEVR